MASRRGPRGSSWLPWVGVIASLVVIAAASALVVLSAKEGDLSNPDVPFADGQTTPGQPRPVQRPPKKGHPADDGFAWPMFGLVGERTRVLELDEALRPPFRISWRVRSKHLLEFPAVLCRRSVFLLADDGRIRKISRWTGTVEWKRHLGHLAAASPACDGRRLYAVMLRRFGSDNGSVVALDADKGRKLWERPLPARAESSPLVHRGVLYFGTEDGTVYAIRARTNRLLWKFRASGAVKGAVALSEGRLYFGTYGGRVYAIGREKGNLVWSRDVASGGALGLGGGNFYSGAAVAYGRVYLGATNGAVYSLSARTGEIAWRRQTGDYVYASPAVGAVAGGPPTVWIGSYNGTLYALDARSGQTHWTRSLGGKLSGSPTVIGDLVFQSSFDRRRTWAVGANTGRTIWTKNRGAFTSAISDGRRIYFNGYGTLYALDPKGRRFADRPLPGDAPAFTRYLARKRAKAAREKARREGRSGKRRAATSARECRPQRSRREPRRSCARGSGRSKRPAQRQRRPAAPRRGARDGRRRPRR